MAESNGTQSGNGAENSFFSSAQDAISSAVDATLGAVKEHPVAAATLAAAATAAVGGAVYAASQRSTQRGPAKA